MLSTLRALTLLTVMSSLLPLPSTTSQRCSGRIVTTAKDVEELAKCSVIEGPLIVKNLQAPSRDHKGPLPSLCNVTQITHFLFIFRLGIEYRSLSQLLPNLAVIRGHRLFNGEDAYDEDAYYALVIEGNSNLMTIGLAPLPKILRGNVRLSNNPVLEQPSRQEWQNALFDNHTQKVTDDDESPLHLRKLTEPLCEPKSHLINYAMCSGVPQGCFASPVCNFTSVFYNGSCLQSCPENTSLMDGWECVLECRKVATFSYYHFIKKINTFSHSHAQDDRSNHTCEYTCPDGFQGNFETLECEKCNQSCHTVCNSLNTVVTNYTQLQRLKNCNKINGSLEISFQGDVFDHWELRHYLDDVQEITGYLFIYRCHGLNALNFFINLKKIASDPTQPLWQNKYALALFDNPDLSHLWPGFKHLVVPTNSSAYVRVNPRLCKEELNQIGDVFSKLDSKEAGNSISGICESHPLILSFSTITTTSLIVHWKLDDDHRNDSNRYEILSYLVYYISMSELSVYYDIDVDSDKVLDLLNEASPSVFDEWYLKQVGALETSVLITELVRAEDYAVHVVAYTVSGFQEGQKSNVTIVRTLDGFSTDLSIIDVSNCCADTMGNVSVTWAEPKGTNGDLITYWVKPTLQPWHVNRMRSRDVLTSVLVLPPPLRDTEPNVTCYQSCHLVSPGEDEDENEDEDGNEKEEWNDYIDEMFGSLASTTYPCLKSNQVKEVPANITSLQLRNLNPFSLYVITIQANTSAGCGLVSTGKWIITPPSVEADMVLQLAVDFNDSVLEARWLRPENPNGGYISSYEVNFTMETSSNLELEPKYTNQNCYKQISGIFVCDVNHMEKIVIRSFTVLGMTTQSVSGTLCVGSHSLFPWPRDRIPTVCHPFVVTASSNPSESHSSNDVALLASLCVACGLLLILVASLVFVGCRRRKKRRRRKRWEARAGSGYLGALSSLNPTFLKLEEVYKVDHWEVDRRDITVKEVLGEGSFATVHMGTLVQDNASINVAIKTLAIGCSEEEKVQFLKEASVMKEFESDHIVRLLGIVSQSDPILVIMELMTKGDLKNHLRSMRPEEMPSDMSSFEHFPLTEDDLKQMASQIAAGMAYLSGRKIVHRDLAARNCMVANNGYVKVGDFGFARDIYQNDYYRKRGRGPMPIRWMPPESLRDGVFAVTSDVWSYGVVLWEIITLGAQPYPGMSNEEVMTFVLSKQLMDMVHLKHAPEVYCLLMKMCWQFRPSDRPTFEDVLATLPAVIGYEVQI